MKKESGRFAAQPLAFSLPLRSRSWAMNGISFDSGSFDIARDNTGAIKVSVKQGTDGMPAYSGTLPLSVKELPVDQVADIIRARNPEPKEDPQKAIGGIIDRLEDMDKNATGDGKNADHVDIFKTAPPVSDVPMPPQPAPPLPEVEVGAPPTLPDDTPLAVDPVELPVSDEADLSQEIFPIESDEALPVE